MHVLLSTHPWRRPHVSQGKSLTLSVSDVPQVGSVSVDAEFTYADSTSAAAVGHTVEFIFSVRNTGLLTLFEVDVNSTYLQGRGSSIKCVADASTNMTYVGSSAGVVSGMMPYPDGGLIPGKSIECTSSVEANQSEVSWGGCT